MPPCNLLHVRCFTFYLELLDPILIDRIDVHRVCSDLKVFAFIFTAILFFGNRPFLNKDIVVESVIPMQNCHKSHDLCSVRNVVRRVSLS